MSERQHYNIVTPNGEKVFTEPGKNGPEDMKIFTMFPKMPWPHSLYYIAVCLRLKAKVEDRNYPPPAQGRGKLMDFCYDCIFSKLSIREICEKHKIPIKE